MSRKDTLGQCVGFSIQVDAGREGPDRFNETWWKDCLKFWSVPRYSHQNVCSVRSLLFFSLNGSLMVWNVECLMRRHKVWKPAADSLDHLCDIHPYFHSHTSPLNNPPVPSDNSWKLDLTHINISPPLRVPQSILPPPPFSSCYQC